MQGMAQRTLVKGMPEVANEVPVNLHKAARERGHVNPTCTLHGRLTTNLQHTHAFPNRA
jgi:hypothetical protein